MGKDYRDAQLNELIITGNLTRDPELHRFDSGSGVCSFGIAHNERYKKGDEWVEEVSFFDVKSFGAGAEALSARIRKGEAVLVKGRIAVDTWEQDGAKRSKVYIKAFRVQQMTWPDEGATPKLSGAGKQEDELAF